MQLKKINYSDLNARQKENFNFQKVSAVLADYGFVTFRLTDDWQGADFIALHLSGEVLRVQLKSRLCFYKKYQGKGLHITFSDGVSWYLYPHDKLLAEVLDSTAIGSTRSWLHEGGYSFPGLTSDLRALLEPYCIMGSVQPLPMQGADANGPGNTP